MRTARLTGATLVAATEGAVATDAPLPVRLPPAPPGKPPAGAGRWLFLAVAAGVGALIGYWGSRHGADLLQPIPGPKALKLLLLAWLPFAWLIVVAVHELGHLVGGWLTGGRFLLWVVGPFKVQRTPAGIHWGLNRSVNLSGGMAACLPLEPGKLTPARAAVMIVGGPAASVLLAAATWGLARWLGSGSGPDSVAGALAQNAALITALVSALIFVVTVLPATVGGFKTDGKRVADLLRGDRRSDQEAAVLALTTATLAGQRPADFEPALVARATALNDGSLFDLYGHLTVYPHAVELGRWRAAQQHLDKVLQGEAMLVPYVRAAARCEYAWLLAMRTADAAAARAWLESAGPMDFDPATRLRAEAAVLLAEERYAEAGEKARAGLHALHHRSLSPVASPFALEALEELMRLAQSRQRVSWRSIQPEAT